MKLSSFVIALLGLASTAFSQNLSLTLTNGVEGGAEIPYNAQLIPATGITLEAWITYDDSSLIPGWAHPTIVRQRVGGGGEAYFLRVNAGNTGATRLSFAIQRQAGFLEWCEWDFAPGQLLPWTHVAATYDGAWQRLFINGAEVNSVARTGGVPLLDQGGALHIGKGDPGSTSSHYENWNGQIDELRMWPFARTEAEIQNTMNVELSSMPGLVSTWNFNASDFSDSSSGMNGTAIGTVNFTNNAPTLITVPHPGVASAGAGTPGCLGPILPNIASLPRSGNQTFTFVAYAMPAGAPVAFVFGPSVLASPVQVAGLSLWPDIFSPASFFVPATNDPLGVARFTMPIPAWVPVGSLFAGQFIALDACGPQGLTASDAMAGTIIP